MKQPSYATEPAGIQGFLGQPWTTEESASLWSMVFFFGRENMVESHRWFGVSGPANPDVNPKTSL